MLDFLSKKFSNLSLCSSVREDEALKFVPPSYPRKSNFEKIQWLQLFALNRSALIASDVNVKQELLQCKDDARLRSYLILAKWKLNNILPLQDINEFAQTFASNSGKLFYISFIMAHFFKEYQNVGELYNKSLMKRLAGDPENQTDAIWEKAGSIAANPRLSTLPQISELMRVNLDLINVSGQALALLFPYLTRQMQIKLVRSLKRDLDSRIIVVPWVAIAGLSHIASFLSISEQQSLFPIFSREIFSNKMRPNVSVLHGLCSVAHTLTFENQKRVLNALLFGLQCLSYDEHKCAYIDAVGRLAPLFSREEVNRIKLQLQIAYEDRLASEDVQRHCLSAILKICEMLPEERRFQYEDQLKESTKALREAFAKRRLESEFETKVQAYTLQKPMDSLYCFEASKLAEEILLEYSSAFGKGAIGSILYQYLDVSQDKRGTKEVSVFPVRRIRV